MSDELRKPGLTIGSLLLLVLAFGLLAAVLFPVYRRAVHTTTLRRTMADIGVWNQAIADFAADHQIPPTNPNGEISFKKPIIEEVRPYLPRIRTADWWGTHYRIWIGPSIDEYGLRATSPNDVLIVSTGKKGIRELWRYDPIRPEGGFFALDELQDFEKDLVVWNRKPLRWPKDQP